MARAHEQRAAVTLADERWPAVVSRDSERDKDFVYSVKTTGVYCRPSCGSRTPKPENVSFHATGTEAQKAGFRACKRCQPDGPGQKEKQLALVAALCRKIETAEIAPTLEDLAEAAGMSAFYLHRVFKEVTGVTPKAYAQAHRANKLRAQLGRGRTITEAIYDAGYNSGSRFYENSEKLLGMTPQRYRAGGAGAVIRFAVGACSLGDILVATSEKGVCAILIGDDAEALLCDLQDRFPKAELIGGDAEFERVVALVVGFVETPGKGLDLPLDIRGTPFQQRVWEALQEIPIGQTVSYADIAKRIGQEKAVRAVARACAANHLAVAIPCHRVVRNDGALSGYRWGIERKRALLRMEAEA